MKEAFSFTFSSRLTFFFLFPVCRRLFIRDRFILIYCPSRSRRYCNTRKAKWMVLVSVLVLGLANGHILFGYERVNVRDRNANEFYDCNIPKEKIFYSRMFGFYDSYVESVLFVIIPFVVMSICSLLIILQIFETRKTIRYNNQGKFYYYTFYTSETIQKTVRKSLNEQQQGTRLRDKDIQLCCMLIGTTLAFLLLCLPTEINDAFNYSGQHRSCRDWFRKVLLMLMQQIYYAGHFYIYTLTGQLFRKHLYAMLFGTRHHRSLTESKDPSFPRKILTTRSPEYQQYPRHSSILLQHRESKPSYSTSSCVNTTVHRLTITTHELTQVHGNENYPSNDPSQRLLSDSKSMLGSY